MSGRLFLNKLKTWPKQNAIKTSNISGVNPAFYFTTQRNS